jgi:integrase
MFVLLGDADSWIAGKRLEHDQDRLVCPNAPNPDEMTFRQWAEKLIEIPGRKPKTVEEYRRRLDRVLLPTFGRLRLSQISRGMVTDWYATLKPHAPTERARCYELLSTVMRAAEDRELIDRCPCKVKGARRVRRAKLITLPTPAQIESLAKALPSEYSLIAHLGAYCGLRIGEAKALRRCDIDLRDPDRPRIWVRQNVQTIEGQIEVGTPKTPAGADWVAIPIGLVPTVKAHLKSHVGQEHDALLFLGRNGTHLPTSTWQDLWTKARATAAIPEVTFHTLRHFAGTMMYAQSKDLELVRRFLRQADLGVTRLYIEEFESDQTTAANAVYERATALFDASPRVTPPPPAPDSGGKRPSRPSMAAFRRGRRRLRPRSSRRATVSA